MIASTSSQRWLKTIGYRVTYVRNITDIDDKIIRRALERGISIRALTDEMIEALHQDADALGIERPTHEPRATQYVPQMLEMIATLEKQGPRLPERERRRQLRGAQVPRLRQALGQVDRPAARRRARRRARRQGGPARLRDVEGGQGERARRRASGRARTAPAARAGTSSARRCARRCSASTSTSTAAARTCSSRTTRTRSRRARAADGGPFAQRLDAQRPRSTSTTRRCRSRSATSSPSARCWSATTARRCASSCVRTHYRSPFNFSDVNLDDARSALRRLYTALDAVAAERRRHDRLERAARRRVPRGDGRRLQHADRRRGAVRARSRGEPRPQGRRSRRC